MSLSSDIMDMRPKKDLAGFESEARLRNVLVATVWHFYAAGHKDARDAAAEIVEQEQQLINKEIESNIDRIVENAFESTKSAPDSIKHISILCALLGALSGYFGKRYCTKCGKILPHENCFEAKTERG